MKRVSKDTCLGRHCERSEAIQKAIKKMDCHVAYAPHNNGGGKRY